MKVVTKLKLDAQELTILEQATQLLYKISDVDNGDLADEYFPVPPTILEFGDLALLLETIVEQNKKENF